MSHDLLLRRQIPRDFSRGGEIALLPALTPERTGLRSITVMSLGIASALASSYPKTKQRQNRS